jgi:parallel beta-helix repeat protein
MYLKVISLKFVTTYKSLIMKIISVFIAIFSLQVTIAQYVNLPQIITPSTRIYMSPVGSDSNIGDSLSPVATFSKALDLLNAATSNQSGEVYTEVVLFEGLYLQALIQPLNKFQFANRNLNVSVRGKGTVELDGQILSSISSGSGMVHLLGSHIYVKGINILFSPANGVRFGFNYNGTVINSADILIENVSVSATAGHGILVGIGALNTANQFTLTPKANRFLIQNCQVHDAVNFNTVQPQWGSAIKAWNASNVTVRNCVVRDNGGEGIDFDDCDSVDVYANEVVDNVVGIYLDKVTNGWVHRNAISNSQKQSPGMLFAMEAFTSLITNHYIKNIKIFNNILLNTRGLHFWQGIYGANQQGYFDNIEIAHNTIIGRQTGNGSCLHFNFETFLGQPALNVHFNQISMHRNIISASPDSLNNNQLIFASLPIPGFSAAFNIYKQAVWASMSGATDVIDASLPISLNNWTNAIPGSGPVPIHLVTLSSITTDFAAQQRHPNETAAGAYEFDLIGLPSLSQDELRVYPNPSQGILEIFGLGSTQIAIYDASGVLQMSLSYEEGQKLDLSHLQAGLYVLHLENGQHLKVILK